MRLAEFGILAARRGAFALPAGTWAGMLLVRVAERLAAARAGSGVLLEQRVAVRDPGTTVTPSDPIAATIVLHASRGVPGGGGFVPVPGPALPPPELASRCVVVGFVDEPQRRPPDTDSGPFEPPNRRRVGSPASPDEGARRFPDDLLLHPGADLPRWTAEQIHWRSEGTGRLSVSHRLWVADAPDSLEPRIRLLELALRERYAGAGARRTVVVSTSSRPRFGREWRSGAARRPARHSAVSLEPGPAARVSAAVAIRDSLPGADGADHAAALGASGSGKSAYLVAVVRSWIERGGSAVVFDVHGDVSAAILSGLSPVARERVLAIDPARTFPRVPAVGLLGSAPSEAREAEVGQVVAALKRLTPDGTDLYWGFRLERLFDTFVRLVQEEGGGLRELYELFTSEPRREAARLTTSVPEIRRFLEELPAILRRNPEFLWPAVARLSKIVLSPPLSSLLISSDRELPVDDAITAGRSVVWRLPFGEFGPEASAFVATLLASRVYLGRVRAVLADPARGSPERSVLFAIDEAHALSPRLLTEILSEGRKFGVRVILATQYPERLAPELRAAVAATVGTHLLFRLPRAVAGALAPWVGVPPSDAERWIPALPAGVAIAVESGPNGTRRLLELPEPRRADPDVWVARAHATADEFASEVGEDSHAASREEGRDALLWAALASESGAGVATATELIRWAVDSSPTPLDPEAVARELARAVRLGWLREEQDRFHLTPAGARLVGVGVRSGATTESDEHRALLAATIEVFARHGGRIEVVRQGRFDTRLPDGRFRQVALGSDRLPPHRALAALERARGRWMWKAFHGRDVFVEAEVTGAMRRERVRRNLEKARHAGAHVLFVVSTPDRARRIRAVLNEARVGRLDATVWTIPDPGGRALRRAAD